MSNYLREMKASILNKLFCTLVTWLHHKKQPSWTEQYICETFSKRDCSTILQSYLEHRIQHWRKRRFPIAYSIQVKKKKAALLQATVMCQHVHTPQCLVHPHRSKLFRSVSSCRNKDEKVSSKVFLLRRKLLLVTIIYLHISLLQVQLNCMEDIDLLQSKTQ